MTTSCQRSRASQAVFSATLMDSLEASWGELLSNSRARLQSSNKEFGCRYNNGVIQLLLPPVAAELTCNIAFMLAAMQATPPMKVLCRWQS